MKNNLVLFMKAWIFPDKNYGEKEIWLNVDFEIKRIEWCRLRKPNGATVECTKIHYADEMIVVLGTPQEFFKKCKDSNTSMAFLSYLDEEGITMKDFLQQTQQLTGINN